MPPTANTWPLTATRVKFTTGKEAMSSQIFVCGVESTRENNEHLKKDVASCRYMYSQHEISDESSELNGSDLTRSLTPLGSDL